MTISMEQIKALRDETEISVMQCKKALEEASGDMEKARMILAKKSSAIAAKKAGRETKSGYVAIAKENGRASMVELLCETDFVAKNEDFIALAEKLATYALKNGTKNLMEETREMIDLIIQKIGENIKLGESIILENPIIGSYVHDGHIGVLVALSGGDEILGKDIAMHIAAMKPVYIEESEIPVEKRKAMQEIFENEVSKEDKPEEIKKKIIEGKIASYFKEQTLLDQLFIKDQNLTIKNLLESKGNVHITQFFCYTI